MPEITENTARSPLFDRYVDIIRVGGGQMRNFALLRELARQAKPVILTRGESSTIEEALISADYLMSGGNQQRHHLPRPAYGPSRPYTNLTLDISAAPVIRSLSHLPVMVDPEPFHRDGAIKLTPLARAALAAGCRRTDARKFITTRIARSVTGHSR
jgi:3-deoxy-7-phosphoheptulonate synthase